MNKSTECGERINTLEGSVTYLESEIAHLYKRIDTLTTDLKACEDALDEILEKTCGNELSVLSDNLMNQWSIEQKKRFVIVTIKNRMLTLYKRILAMTEQQSEEKESNKVTTTTASAVYTSMEQRARESGLSTNKHTEQGESLQLKEAQADIMQILSGGCAVEGPGTSMLKMRKKQDTVQSTTNGSAATPTAETETAERSSGKVSELFAKRSPAYRQGERQGGDFTVLNDVHKEVVLLIGDTGEFIKSRIIDILMNQNPMDANNRNKYYLALNYLEESEVIKKIEETIQIGAGRPSNGYELTPLGIEFYQKITAEQGERKTPIQSLYVGFQQNAKSTEHGEFIRKVEEHLLLSGYKTTTNEREMRLNLPNGGASICDILALKSGEYYRIEVECAKYNTADMQVKIKKILETSKNKILFVCKNVVAKKFVEQAVLIVLSEIYGMGKKYLFEREGGILSIVTYDEFVAKKNWPECEMIH